MNNEETDERTPYATAFLGVPRVEDDPNFQGGDEGRDVLNDPINIKTGIESSEYATQPNRKTITVVGGLLVACFCVAFILIGYVLYRRRRSYRRRRVNSRRDTDLAMLAGTAGPNGDDGDNAFAQHYNLDKRDNNCDNDATDVGDNDQDIIEDYEGPANSISDPLPDDEGQPQPQHQQQKAFTQETEYPDLPMSAEAIQMDLGG